MLFVGKAELRTISAVFSVVEGTKKAGFGSSLVDFTKLIVRGRIGRAVSNAFQQLGLSKNAT